MPTTITPYLSYEDVGRAVAHLAGTFGLVEFEDQRVTGPDGTVMHTEMRLGDARVMMGRPGDDYRSPKQAGGAEHFLLYAEVDDVAAHHDRAKAAGAQVTDLEDTFYGHRRYSVEDLEGHRWTFAQQVRVVDPKDWELPKG